MATKEEEDGKDKARLRLHIRSNALSLSQIASMAIEKDISEKELIEDQNKAVEENFNSLAPQVYAFRQKAAIFGHDAPSYAGITLGNDTLKNNLSDWDSTELHIFEKVNVEKS